MKLYFIFIFFIHFFFYMQHFWQNFGGVIIEMLVSVPQTR